MTKKIPDTNAADDFPDLIREGSFLPTDFLSFVHNYERILHEINNGIDKGDKEDAWQNRFPIQ
jgi:hypothetical protein